MIAVTTEQLAQVDEEAEQAQLGLREAERTYASNRSSPDAYTRHQEAVERADHTALRARLLRADWEEQQAARDQRAADGEAAVREMAGDVERLAGSRAAAVGAVVEAVAAMGRALDALGEHDRLVRAASAGLAARGLRCVDGEPTGANLDESALIGGVKWPLVDGASVLGRCLVEQVAARQPRHSMARLVWPPYGGVSASEGRDEVLALVHGERRG